MKFAVEKDIIDDSKRRDSSHCMVADTIARKLDVGWILVDVQSIRWSDKQTGERYTYMTPPAVQQAIIRFDQGKPVKPFAFSLGKPVSVRAMQHVRAGDPAKVKKARATYEAKHRNAGSPNARNLASRQREFGVRMLEA